MRDKEKGFPGRIPWARTPLSDLVSLWDSGQTAVIFVLATPKTGTLSAEYTCSARIDQPRSFLMVFGTHLVDERKESVAFL